MLTLLSLWCTSAMSCLRVYSAATSESLASLSGSALLVYYTLDYFESRGFLLDWISSFCEFDSAIAFELLPLNGKLLFFETETAGFGETQSFSFSSLTGCWALFSSWVCRSEVWVLEAWVKAALAACYLDLDKSITELVKERIRNERRVSVKPSISSVLLTRLHSSGSWAYVVSAVSATRLLPFERLLMWSFYLLMRSYCTIMRDPCLLPLCLCCSADSC